MRHFLALLLILAPSIASAQSLLANTPNNITLTGLTGCNATAINSASECELKDTTYSYAKKFPLGYNLMTLYIFYDWAAGTGYSFNIEACIEGMESTDCTDSTDWFPVHGETYATGTLTLAKASVTKDSISADDYAVWSVAINYPRIKLTNILASGTPSASDKITIKAVFTNSGAF